MLYAGVSDGKESTCNAGDLNSAPGSGRSPAGGNGYPLQYSCLENPKDRGAWQGPWGCKQLDLTERLSIYTHTMLHRKKKYIAYRENKDKNDIRFLF